MWTALLNRRGSMVSSRWRFEQMLLCPYDRKKCETRKRIHNLGLPNGNCYGVIECARDRVLGTRQAQTEFWRTNDFLLSLLPSPYSHHRLWPFFSSLPSLVPRFCSFSFPVPQIERSFSGSRFSPSSHRIPRSFETESRIQPERWK